jgi:sulfur carrier protein
MNVVVNGTPRELPDEATVADVVRELDVDAATGVAVARNGEVVLRARWAEQQLSAGDHVEVLHAVQGG